MFTLEMWTAADFSDLSTPLYIYTLQTNPSQAYRNLESYIIVFLESRRAYQCVICLRRPRMDFFKRYTYNKCFSAYLIYIM